MHSLIQSLPSAIVFLDGDVIVGWNDAAASLYGWPSHDVLGQRFHDVLVDESDLDEADEVLGHARSRRRWEGNFRLRRRDGALLVSSFAVMTVRDGDDDRIAWVATDAVDQHMAEQEREVLLGAQHAARRELEATVGLLEALLECAPIGIAMLDLDLLCTHANTTFARMISVASPPVGAYLDDLATLPAEVVADLRRVVTTGRSFTDRRLSIRPEAAGPVRHINANYFPIYAGEGLPAGAGLTWTDITAAQIAEGERAQLAERANAAQHRLAMLASTSAVLTGTTDVDVLLERLARVLAPAACDWCIIELIDKVGVVEHIAVSHVDRSAAHELRSALLGQLAEPTPESATATVRRTGQALLLSGKALSKAAEAAATSAAHQRFAQMELTSTIVVPIKTRGGPIGVLIMANTSSTLLNEDDLDLAVEIGHRAAFVLDRAITYQTEHVLAEQLQQALLPGAIPTIAGCHIATRYSATADVATVGGDWYDVIELSPTQVLLCVGDVIGHNTGAAVAMSRLRYVIHAFASESLADSDVRMADPAAVLNRVERLIYEDSSAWGTCVVALLDPTTQVLRWSSAGHPPILMSRDGTVTQLEGGRGPMLGVSRHAPRSVASVQLFAGDRLLMYTDGLIERRAESLDTGLARLADAMRSFCAHPLEQMCGAINRVMLEGVDQSDDIAILAAEVHDGAGVREPG